MKIESYKFGEMIVDGIKYRKDLIIFPDYVMNNWWRKSGHNLIKEDILEIIDAKPEYLFIGTGKFGLMKVSKEIISYLESLGITVFIGKTDDAVKVFNNETNSNKISAFHLTC